MSNIHDDEQNDLLPGITARRETERDFPYTHQLIISISHTNKALWSELRKRAKQLQLYLKIKKRMQFTEYAKKVKY